MGPFILPMSRWYMPTKGIQKPHLPSSSHELADWQTKICVMNHVEVSLYIISNWRYNNHTLIIPSDLKKLIPNQPIFL